MGKPPAGAARSERGPTAPGRQWKAEHERPASAAPAAPVTARSPLDRGRSVLFGNSGGCRHRLLELPQVCPRRAERSSPARAQRPPHGAAPCRRQAPPPGTARSAAVRAHLRRASASSRGDGWRRAACRAPPDSGDSLGLRGRFCRAAPSRRRAFPSKSRRAPPADPTPPPEAGACRAGAGPRQKAGAPAHLAPARAAGRRSAAVPAPASAPVPTPPPRPEGSAEGRYQRRAGPRPPTAGVWGREAAA